MRKLTITMVAVLLAITVFAADNSEKEITSKAEFLIELVDHVEWKQTSGDSVTIFVIGESPVSEKLQELAANASSDKRKITVENVSVNDDLSACQILFLTSDDLGVLAKVLKKVNGTNTVTVADAKDFARYGATISFDVDEGSKVKYVVNKLVAESAGVKLDSKILDKAVLI